MPILLAACSALVYGIADYCGGRASRSHPSTVVTVVGQAVSLVLIVAAVAVMGTPSPAAGAWWWGGSAGAAGAIGLAALYFGLAQGTMTVVAPIAAVVGAVLPVVVGLSSGERPNLLGYAGMVIAVLAVALVSGVVGAAHAGPVPRAAIAAAVVAGTGFGLLFVLLDRAPGDSGLWPLVAARVVSVPLLLVAVVATRVRPGAARGLLAYAVLAGALDMAANVLYLEAVRGGLLSLVAVVSSLYPASTVVLAYGVDGERFSRSQAVGMALAAAALVLVTLGRP
jgi:drug/metabolite transporter (DMT)-like permease